MHGGFFDLGAALVPVEGRMLQGREAVVGLDRGRVDGGRDLEGGRGAGRRGEGADASGADVAQRPASRGSLHHPGHVVMTQLGLEMGEGVRVALEARVDHARMRKSGVHVGDQGVRQAQLLLRRVRFHAPVRHRRRRVVVVLPALLAVVAPVVPGRQFGPARRPRLGRLAGGGRRLAPGPVLPPHVLRVGQLVVLLPLHPTVLEPDLDLPLGQDQGVSDLDTSPSRQVPIVMELLLELEDLVPRVRGPLPFGLHPGLVRAVR